MIENIRLFGPNRLYFCRVTVFAVAFICVAVSNALAGPAVKGSPIDPSKVVWVNAKYKKKPVKSQCGPAGSNGAWVTGKMIKGNRFLTSKDEAKDLKKKAKKTTGTKLTSIQKRQAALKLIMKVLPSKCIEAGSQIVSANSPTASNVSGSGTGLEPIALQLPVSAGAEGASITCAVVGAPSGVQVEFVSPCGVLAHANDHRVSSGSFQFKGIRNTDGAESTVATASLTWDQSGQFIGDENSMAHYKDSLNVREAKYLAYWVGGNISQAVQQATQPGGLDSYVNSLLTPSSAGCAQAMAEAEQLAAYEEYQWCYYDASRGFCFYTPNTDAGRMQWNQGASATYQMRMMLSDCNPLRERMALFWSNHFAVTNSYFSGSSDTRNHYVKEQFDLLRSDVPQAQGDIFLPFGKMLSPLYGEKGTYAGYLDNYSNSFLGGGNQNLGRELLERSTMGVSDPITGQLNYNEPTVDNMRFPLMGYYETTPVNEASHTVCCESYRGRDDNNDGIEDPNCPTWAEPTCSQCRTLEAAGTNCQVQIKRKTLRGFSDTRWNLPGEPIGTMMFPGTPYAQYRVGWKANTTEPDEDNLTPFLTNLPMVPRYLAARFIGTFASPDITESTVAPIAAKLSQNELHPREALRTIFSSSSFFSSGLKGVANPIETYMYFLKAMGLPLQHYRGTDLIGREKSILNLFGHLRNSFQLAGQDFWNSPSVFGVNERGQINNRAMYKGEVFLTAQYWLERWKNFNWYLYYLDRFAIAPQGSTLRWTDFLPPSPAHRNPEAVLNHFVAKLPFDLTSTERSLLMEYLTTVSTQSSYRNGGEIPTSVWDYRGTEVPTTGYTFTINWAELTDTQLNELLSLKINGLIFLLFSLKGVHFR